MTSSWNQCQRVIVRIAYCVCHFPMDWLIKSYRPTRRESRPFIKVHIVYAGSPWKSSMSYVKVAEDDIAFKLAILKKSLHLNDNTCFCSIIQSSKLVLGSLLAKNNFFVQFWTKNFASSRMANCGSGLPAEWPFRSQNAIEASDSPLPGGLWVKRLITHALCSLAYWDIAWCKLFLIFTMKCLYWVFFAYKTPYSVLIDNSIHIQEINTEITWLTLQGQIFRCIKHISVSQLKYLYIVSVKYFR